MALGSANEMVVHIEIACELEYAKVETCNILTEDYVVICKMLYRLIENWRTIPAKPSNNLTSDFYSLEILWPFSIPSTPPLSPFA